MIEAKSLNRDNINRFLMLTKTPTFDLDWATADMSALRRNFNSLSVTMSLVDRSNKTCQTPQP